MNNPRNLKIVIVLLSMLFFALLGYLGFTNREISWWKAENGELACTVGGLRAMHDFEAGKFRLFVIAGKQVDDSYTGTNDGPFQIWVSHYFPEQPYPDRFSIEQGVAMYNAVMKFHAQTNKVLPTNSK